MRLLRLDDPIAFYTNARPFFSYRLRKNGWIEQKVCIVPSRAIYLGSFSKDLPLDRGKLTFSHTPSCAAPKTVLFGTVKTACAGEVRILNSSNSCVVGLPDIYRASTSSRNFLKRQVGMSGRTLAFSSSNRMSRIEEARAEWRRRKTEYRQPNRRYERTARVLNPGSTA
jgi:hypothetical protein